MPTRISKGFLAALVIGWGGLFAAISWHLAPLQIVLGVPLTLVAPGLLALQASRLVFRRLEWWALVFACSLVLLIAAVFVAAALPSGITPTSTSAVLAGLSAVLAVLSLLARRAAPLVLAQPVSGGAAPRPTARRRTVVAWAMACVIVAVYVTSAVLISVRTERASAEQALTQLSLTGNGGADGYVLQVHNREGERTTYRLEVTLPGSATTTQNLTLADGETYSETLRPTGIGEVVARLYGGSTSSVGYRQVETSVG